MSNAIQVACPHCFSVNRLPTNKLGDGAKCGKCKQALFTGEPIELNTGNYEAMVNRSDLPIVVDFWAGWCGPCKIMAPMFAQVTRELEPRLRFAKLDTEAEQSIAGRFGIRSIPTLIVFRRGQEVARQAGVMQASELTQWLQPHLQQDLSKKQ